MRAWGAPKIVLLIAAAPAAACGLGLAGTDSSQSSTTDAAPTSTSSITPTAGEDANVATTDASSDVTAIDATPVGIGTLTVTNSMPGGTADLDTLGPGGWVHWGRNNTGDIDRLSGMDPTLVLESLTAPSMPPNLMQFGDDVTSFTWTNGTPTKSESGTSSGIYTKSAKGVFTLVLSADPTPRVASLFVGGFSSHARLTVTLGTGAGAPTYVDLEDNPNNNYYELYTIDYSATSAGTPLTIAWTMLTQDDPNNANITLSSIALK